MPPTFKVIGYFEKDVKGIGLNTRFDMMISRYPVDFLFCYNKPTEKMIKNCECMITVEKPKEFYEKNFDFEVVTLRESFEISDKFSRRIKAM